jgi:hypothetical protein
MEVFDDDGNGPQRPTLYITGKLTTDSAAMRFDNLARLNQGIWQLVGGGICASQDSSCRSAEGRALALYDEDGDGPCTAALYVGGKFDAAGGISARGLAKWDGTEWSNAAGGVYFRLGDHTWPGEVNCFRVHRDGPPDKEPRLYVGGWFERAGDADSWSIASWDGQAWSPCAGGVSGVGNVGGEGPGIVRAVLPFESLRGESRRTDLLVAGRFARAGVASSRIVVTRDIAVWDESTWTAFDNRGVYCEPISFIDQGCQGTWQGIQALSSYDQRKKHPHKSSLYIGGSFNRAGPTGARTVVHWQDGEWLPLANGLSSYGQPAAARAFAVLEDDPSARGHASLFASGGFRTAGALFSPFIARWHGHYWSRIDATQFGYVAALAVWDEDGPGPMSRKIYVGNWERLGRIDDDNVIPVVVAPIAIDLLTTFDMDGHGPRWPALIAGNNFVLANRPIQGVARWDGTQWSKLGEGLEALHDAGPVVNALIECENKRLYDGTRILYVGGDFVVRGLPDAKNLASWDGRSWKSIPSPPDSYVEALAVFEDGNGPALYVGGYFQTAGDQLLRGLARWDGENWSGVPGWGSGYVRALMSFDDDGKGPKRAELYVAGFLTIDVFPDGASLAKWNGTKWTAIATTDLGSYKYAMTAFDDDPNDHVPPSLFVGGTFWTAGGIPSHGIARWGRPCFHGWCPR